MFRDMIWSDLGSNVKSSTYAGPPAMRSFFEHLESKLVKEPLVGPRFVSKNVVNGSIKEESPTDPVLSDLFKDVIKGRVKTSATSSILVSTVTGDYENLQYFLDRCDELSHPRNIDRAGWNTIILALKGAAESHVPGSNDFVPMSKCIKLLADMTSIPAEASSFIKIFEGFEKE